MKKVCATLLAMVLLLTCIPLGAVSVSAATSGGYTYTISDGEATITSYYGSGGDITIPTTLGGYPVTAIGVEAFYDCTELTSVTVQNDSITIHDLAFDSCTKLGSVTIQSGIINIATRAFTDCCNLTAINIAQDNQNYCSVEGVLFNKSQTTLIKCPTGKPGTYNVPNSVTTIGEEAFYGCSNLTSVTIPDSVTRIGNSAFRNCDSLTSVTIGDSVISIDSASFDGCKNLTSINVAKNHKKYSSVEGVLFNKNKTTLIRYPTGRSGTYHIPSSVTVIGNSAFSSCCYLKSVTIGDNVITIGSSSFANCYTLKSITIGSSVSTIGSYAFYSCSNLNSMTIGDSVTIIGDSAFRYCDSLAFLTLPNSISSIGYQAFADCDKLRNVRYYGTDKNDIAIESNNDALCNANWQYIRCANSHTYKKVIVTKATLTKNGKIQNICTKCGYTASKVTTIYKASKVSLSTTSYTYTGSVKKPSVVVKDSMGKTISTAHYTVTYASGRKNVGTYKVTVKFKGNYSGTKTLTFKINPAKTTVKSLTAGKKSLKVAITKKSTQVTGYQIQYSTGKSFKSYKTKWLTSYKKTSTTLTGLSAKKTYYVRVRTYKKVGDVTYYSGWSTIKYKKTK